MRKGFDALSGVVLRDTGREPLCGEVFIFMKRSRTTVKLLHWERGGMVLYHKRLEKGCFSLPVFDEYCDFLIHYFFRNDCIMFNTTLVPQKVTVCSKSAFIAIGFTFASSCLYLLQAKIVR
ncbi:MAG: IS66 family insertion sequence element accessory protein TnpB [Tannerellaceae bacterium]|jgi:hypothetical protein|nr:IS66 family insertion sequence element accessory protein TnpB [Tannerellaceae bacterium]